MIAERHARAVVAALKRAVSRDELDGLRAALPQDFEELLADIPPVPMDMFIGRVAKRTGLNRCGVEQGTAIEPALQHAQAVLLTLREAIDDQEFFDITVQLPTSYDALLRPRPAVEERKFSRAQQ